MDHNIEGIISNDSDRASQEKSSKKYQSLKLVQLNETAVVDIELSPIAYRIFGLLLRHVNHETGRCNPSIELLAALADVSIRTVKRALSELVRLGYIKIESGKGAHHSSNYFFKADKNWLKIKEIDAAARIRWEEKKQKQSERKGSLVSPLKGSPMTPLEDDKGDICVQERGHLCPSNGDTSGTQNSLNRTLLINLGQKEKNEEEKESAFPHTVHKGSGSVFPTDPKESVFPTDPKESVPDPSPYSSQKESASDQKEPSKADYAPKNGSYADEKLKLFLLAYKADASQEKWLPGIRGAFIEKLKDGFDADEIIGGAKRAAETGANKTLPLVWLRNETWRMIPKKLSIHEELDIQNSREEHRQELKHRHWSRRCINCHRSEGGVITNPTIDPNDMRINSDVDFYCGKCQDNDGARSLALPA